MNQEFRESELSQIDDQQESNHYESNGYDGSDYDGNDYDGNDYDGDEYYEDSQASEIEKFTESEKLVEGFGAGMGTGITAVVVILLLVAAYYGFKYYLQYKVENLMV